MLKATNLCCSVGHRQILSDVTFTARPGEITVVVGPNGSGKSTLLKALSGEIASAGTITINGKNLAVLKPWQAASLRAVLPQSSVLTFPFSVREVVRLGLSGGVSGLSRQEADRLPERALERVDLSGFGGRTYNQLSGGEQQRVQLARVLCQVWAPVLEGVPRYLLLDEPVSSLDIKHQLLVMDIARDFAAGGGGVVAVLHDLNLAAMYADSLAIVSAGHVVAQDGPAVALSDDLIETVFSCPLRLNSTPGADIPFILPQSAR
jgi:iron complex transport system ATP-binding protein